jgi:hypothetical protein
MESSWRDSGARSVATGAGYCPCWSGTNAHARFDPFSAALSVSATSSGLRLSLHIILRVSSKLCPHSLEAFSGSGQHVAGSGSRLYFYGLKLKNLLGEKI